VSDSSDHPGAASGPGASGSAVFTRTPRFRALSARQAQVVLSRNRVGRLAFVANGRLELVPVHYVFAGHALFGRTSFGAKCAAWAARTEVVFEVDEADGIYDWRSVIVRGTLRVLPASGTREQRTEHWDAIAVLRSVFPETLTERDPTPTRRCVFTIEPREVTGREASTRFHS
jgi:uncharacterized protein